MPAPPESQTSRYFAWLYAPTSERPLLEALLAIEREVSQSLATTIDHQVAHIRLQWWREELIQLAQGGGTHPLTRTLTAAFGANRQPDTLAQVVGLVENAGWDLARATFENRTELTAYCERWAAALIVPLAAHAGRHAQHLPAQHLPAQQLSDWLAVGASMRELEMLTDLARDARSGRLRLPLDELQRADLDPEGLAKPPWPEGLVRLVRERHLSLRETLHSQLRGVPHDDRNAIRGVLVWAALVCQHSSRAERALPDIAQPRRRDLLADAWCAWRAARRAPQTAAAK